MLFHGGILNTLIKLAIFSFPLALLAFIYLPSVNRSVSSAPPTAKETILKKIPAQQAQPAPLKKEIEPQESSSPFSAIQSESKIYRWVDENGRVSFSDRPTHQNAETYRVNEIGYIAVSSRDKVRIAASEKRALQKDRAVLATHNISSVKSAPVRKPTKDYKFSNISAGQKHKYVILSGRISQGSACKKLRVTATAKSDMGRYVSGHDEVKLSGFGSTLFEIKKSSSWNGGSRRPQWEIDRISAVCAER